MARRRRYTITIVRKGHRYRRSVLATSRKEAVIFLRNRMAARGRRGFHFENPSGIGTALMIAGATAAVGALAVYLVQRFTAPPPPPPPKKPVLDFQINWPPT